MSVERPREEIWREEAERQRGAGRDSEIERERGEERKRGEKKRKGMGSVRKRGGKGGTHSIFFCKVSAYISSLSNSSMCIRRADW